MNPQFNRILFVSYIAIFLSSKGAGQVLSFPYLQGFDSVATANLPAGWSSSQNRVPGTNDFTTSATASLSQPNNVVSTNATINQALYSPFFDLRGKIPDRLSFYTRRTATHLARVVVEASTDSGTTYPIQLGDSLTNAGTNYVLSSIPLPALLANYSGVRFRWRVIADVGGTQGTFRVDDVRVTMQAVHDLAAVSLRYIPTVPTEQDSIVAFARVKNVGLSAATSFQVDFYNDLNNDSLPQPNERIVSTSHPVSLAVSDSVEVSASLGLFPPGLGLIMGQVTYPPDQNALNDRTRSSLHVSYRSHSVVINEIMYAPTNNEPEWVELYNTRSDSIDLEDWLISDNVVTTRRTISVSPVVIPPRTFVVLAKDSSALVDVHPDVPSRVVHLPSLPTLNNAGDAVVVYDNASVTMDSLSYLPGWGGNAGGRSLERVDPVGSSVSQTNWATSRHARRGTPGRINSVTRKDYDIALDTLVLSPPFPLRGDSIIVSVRIRNLGFNPVGSFVVSVFDDANADSVPQLQELFSSMIQPSGLGPLDSVVILFTPFWSSRNEHRLIGVASLSIDEDTLNNTRYTRVEIGIPRNTIVINEIMYSPATEPEWVELKNMSADSADLKGWQLSNRNSGTRYVIVGVSCSVPPHGYVLITKDTALLGQRHGRLSGVILQAPALPTFLFNNSGDAVAVFDNRSLQMDSLKYAPTWGGNSGTSLERVDLLGLSSDSANWASSVDSMQATPGRENSVAIVDYDVQLMAASAITVPPGITAPLSVTVKNAGRLPVTGFDVAFFDDLNRDSIAASVELVARVRIAQPFARSETLRVSVPWQNPSPGAHGIIARAEFPPDVRQRNNTSMFDVRVGFEAGTVVVNEIMFDPFSNEAEYVEIVNVNAMPVDLMGWKLTDRAASGSVNEFPIAPRGQTLSPGQFFVIASDSSLFSRFKNLDTLQRNMFSVVLESGLGLNNEGDAVVIRDITGGMIDSVAYVPSWHHPSVADATGRSLERISPMLRSNDGRSWSSCVLGIGGTPGLANSILAASLPPQASISCAPNPFSPDADGREDFTVIHCEMPIEVATISMRVYDAKGRLIRNLASNEPSGSRRDIVWDGLDNERKKARVGIYVVLVEGLNEAGGNVHTAKGVVVLAARLR